MIRTSNINKNYGKDIKIIVVGNSNSGKTSYVNKWINNSFIENYKATILSDFGSKIVEKNGTIYRVQIWAIAGNLRYKIGQDRSASLTKIFCKDCNGAICISDITAPYSLKE